MAHKPQTIHVSPLNSTPPAEDGESSRKKNMGSEAKGSGNVGGGSGGGGGGGGFKSRIEHYIYSGEKKHVMAGLAIITLAFGIPWYLMSRGSKQLSHQDYMEKADKARNARLSSSAASSR